MARSLAPIALAVAGLLSGAPPASEATSSAPTTAATIGSDAGAPALWSVETLGQGGRVASTVMVCTDATIRAAFARSLPATDGKPCVLIDKPVIGPGRFSARCRVGRADFTVHSDAKGDMATNFNVETVISSEAEQGRQYIQMSRFRRVGACPADWTVGDSAAPGTRTVVNTLSGASRVTSATVR